MAGVEHQVRSHPVLTVAAIACVVAAYQLWWIDRSRPLGSFDTDEAGYMATALRFHRNLVSGGPTDLGRRVSETSTGPLSQLLAVPALVVGGRSTTAALAVQPLLQGTCAVAAAGVARSLAGAGAALLSGAIVLTLPAVLIAGRSFHLGLGAAAMLCLAMWGLLASDRGRRRGPLIGAGLAVGALLLTRTMTVVYVPGLAVATLLVVERSRRSLAHLFAATIVAAALALPWWIAAWTPITDYLLRYGYGDRAAAYGPQGLLNRMSKRTGSVLQGVQPLLLLAMLAVAGSTAMRVASCCRSGADSLCDAVDRRRADLSVVSVVVVGGLALLTTSNAGKWFELPLVVLAVPAVVAAGSRMNLVPRRIITVASVVAIATNLALVGNWQAIRESTGDPYAARSALAAADPRLARGPAERSAGAAAWWSVHQQILDDLAPADTKHVTVTGSSPLLNLNSLLLASELGDHVRSMDEIDTSSENWSPWMTPLHRASERVLVVMSTEGEVFPSDRASDRVLAAATSLGWAEASRVPTPEGGVVRILTHRGGPGPTPTSRDGD